VRRKTDNAPTQASIRVPHEQLLDESITFRNEYEPAKTRIAIPSVSRELVHMMKNKIATDMDFSVPVLDRQVYRQVDPS
jgi:hypothetical protein